MINDFNSKRDLRKYLINSRKELFLNNGINISEIIEKKVIESSLFETADILFGYLDYSNEVVTEDILNEALKRGKSVFVPKVISEDTMEFFEYHSPSDLHLGYKGIREPDENSKRYEYISDSQMVQLMICPGAGFDLKGYRMGYGKGYYDRYLSNKSNIIKIGICFDDLVVDSVFNDKFDVKMDYIFTENRIIQIQ